MSIQADMLNTVEWHSAHKTLPDSDTTVHIHTTADEPVWMGYHDGETWRSVEGEIINVLHWAEIIGPPRSLRSAEIVPGEYLRVWCGYSVSVVVRPAPGGTLEEVTQTGLISTPDSMPEAEWFCEVGAWFVELEAALSDAMKAEAEGGQQEDFQVYDDAGKDIGALRRTLDIMRRRSTNASSDRIPGQKGGHE